MARLDQQLARIAAMPEMELAAEWRQRWGSPAPRLSSDLLRLGLAYRLQEKEHGGVPASVMRSLRRTAAAPAIRVGTQLLRQWHGRQIDVRVEEDGFSFEGRLYASLSAIARKVTGANWSGPRFFGLNAGG